jgi:hypothetical protein
MIWRWRIRQWVGVAIVIAVAGGLFWTAVKHAERAGEASSAAALGEAMSKAARQRVLTP